MCIDIVQTSVYIAISHGVKHVVFGGSFASHPVIRRALMKESLLKTGGINDVEKVK